MAFSEGRQIEPVVFSPPVEQLAGIGQREQEESEQQKKRKDAKPQQDRLAETLEDEQQQRREEPLDGHIDYHA